ncbi:hypothetical protein ACFQY7_10400 [Actinomadura luteofluorescens]|uniref:hypothetical protein n=1 Tax=Actinomadura luteofluorescens TaxID=46163 RepID=UPI003636D82C
MAGGLLGEGHRGGGGLQRAGGGGVGRGGGAGLGDGAFGGAAGGLDGGVPRGLLGGPHHRRPRHLRQDAVGGERRRAAGGVADRLARGGGPRGGRCQAVPDLLHPPGGGPVGAVEPGRPVAAVAPVVSLVVGLVVGHVVVHGHAPSSRSRPKSP